ncbi:MAG: hypothetical protein QOJ76_2461 [Acidobacteriota bacterium]|jgi:hypothetical protein|nr:hypothetical protein [Acidobacteriota bacterium]
MQTVACQSCNFVNADAGTDSKCAQCGEPLVGALLQHNIDEIKRTTERFQELTATSFKSFNGCGTTLLDYRELSDGTWEATRWVVILGLPIVPLAAYRIKPTRQENSYGQMSSYFKILGRNPLLTSRILRVYALMLIGLAPFVLGSFNSTAINHTLGGGLAVFAMLACVAWGIYIIFFKIKNDGKAYKAGTPLETKGEQPSGR